MQLSKQPIKLGNMTIRNRTVSSPLGINMANQDGSVTENIVSYFSNLAKNDLGIVTVGAVAVSKEGGDTLNTMHAGKINHFSGLKKLSDSIKNFGARSCIQLFHVGAQGNTHYSGQPVVGPSKYTVPDIGIEAEVLSIKDINRIENEFINSIYQAHEAGFDLIEIHMGHGYLIHQFLSEHTNKRTDDYGGNENNRMRFITNIIESIKDKSIKEKLAARVTGNDFTPKGLDIDKIKNLIEYLDANSFSYYTVTAGIYETAKQKYINMKKGSYWEYSKKLKQITNTPVVAQGNIMSIAEGEDIIKNSKGDLFGMCQALIADPELVKKSFNNQEDKVFNCLAHVKVGSCHRCRYLKQKNLSFDCVTPAAWRPVDQVISENERFKDLEFWKKTIEKLKILSN